MSVLSAGQVERSQDEMEIVIAQQPPLPNQQLPKETCPSNGIPPKIPKRTRQLKLYRAAMQGDWDTADGIYKIHPEDIRAKMSKGGDTALHIAAAAKHIDFVNELVNKMTKEDLALKNSVGNTALCLAATTGMVELANLMLDKDASLAIIRGSEDMLPLHMAALLGHRAMVLHLYRVTDSVLNDEDRIDLLTTLINTDLYDVALEVLKSRPKLAIARDGHKETALHALARKPLPSSNFASHNQQGLLGRCLNRFSGASMVNNKKLHPQAVELIKCLWEQAVLLSDDEISKLIGSPWRLIFVAAELGNIEFLTIIIREYPDLILKVDDNKNSIFHIGVLNRHEDIFNLIYEIGSIKDLIAAYKDRDGNNMLHLAGHLAPPNRLKIVSGAALQMQRELLWFKEVSKVVQPLYAEDKNKDMKTPRALFTQKHEKLMEKGERWMKDTATSCMLAATLIATVVFAAAFTVPGGNLENVGTPTFLQKASFKIFAISDAISLISSSTSVLSFLTILTSRYAEEDFLWSLPKKLIVGLTTLFISIATMMVVFCATFFIIFQHEMLGVTILVAAVASVPVSLFIWQQHRLFVDVLHSTYGSSSLFKPTKHSLFSDQEVKSTKRKKVEQVNAI